MPTTPRVRELTWRTPLVWAAAALFLLNGVGYAALASRLPELQRDFELTEPQIGLARIGFVVGITAMMFVAPHVVRRFRAQRVAPVAAGLYLVSIGIAGAGFGIASFAGLLLSAGAFNAVVDIGQNVIAVRLEKIQMGLRPETRPNSLLSPMEGLQAVGVTLGSGFGWLTAGRMPLGLSFALLALVGLLVAGSTLVALRHIDAVGEVEQPARACEPADRDTASRTLRERFQAAYPARLRWLTSMSFCALLLEGVLTNWIAILVTTAGSTPATGSACLTAFAGALVVGRMSYSATSARLSQVTFARVLGVLLVAGTVGVATFPASGLGTVACAGAAGLGLSNLHPFCTGAVGHGADAASEEETLGRMNRVAYTGIALESLLIGGLTAWVGLSTAIMMVGFLGILFVVKAPLFGHASRHEVADARV